MKMNSFPGNQEFFNIGLFKIYLALRQLLYQ
jgi:hypothetical protein